MRAPTIRDVAERAGVSKSLVSLVLRGAGPVRPEKRDAVLRAARELGYRPNTAARSLSERRARPHPADQDPADQDPADPGPDPSAPRTTPLVGVLLNDLRNPWFVDLLEGLGSLLDASGLRMVLADARLNRRTGQDPVD